MVDTASGPSEKAGPAGSGSPGLRWWFAAVPLLLIAIIGQMDKLSISVVMANRRFLQDLDLVGKPAVTGLLMSGFLVTYALFQFFWGWFVKKYGPRASAIFGIAIWAATMLASGFAGTAGALISARAVLGMGEAFMFPVFNTFVANWFPLKERARASSFWLNGFPLAPVLGGTLIVAIIGAGGWRWVFFGLAGLSVLIPLPLLIFLMRDRPGQHRFISPAETALIEEGSLTKATEIPKAGAAQEKSDYLGNYRFWLVVLAWGFNNIYYWGWTTWMPTYFQTFRHFSFKSAGYLYSLSFLFALLAIWIVGFWSDRIMRRAPFGAVGWVFAGILMYLGGVAIGNPYWALVALIISLCCEQPAFLMVHALLHSVVPERSMGAAAGIGGGVSSFASMASPALIGLLLQVSGFGAAIVFLSLASLVAGVLYCFLIKEGY